MSPRLPSPLPSNTRSGMIFAAGATSRMIPATIVPWPNPFGRFFDSIIVEYDCSIIVEYDCSIIVEYDCSIIVEYDCSAASRRSVSVCGAVTGSSASHSEGIPAVSVRKS